MNLCKILVKKICHEKNTSSISFIKNGSSTIITTYITFLGHYELTKLGKYRNFYLKSEGLLLSDLFQTSEKKHVSVAVDLFFVVIQVLYDFHRMQC